MIIHSARTTTKNAFEAAKSIFREKFNAKTGDAIFCDSSFSDLIAVTGIVYKAPAVIELLKNREIADYIDELSKKKLSLLFQFDGQTNNLKVLSGNSSGVSEVNCPEDIKAKIITILSEIPEWAGILNDKGEHEIDLLYPQPGPHFNVNLLLGNRTDYPYPLQTTPKSVVDKFGGGSFRSHADTQVLATRWDTRPEENGFPANRQFYLMENNRKIFYSADPNHENFLSAKCIHGKNHTRIIYKTRCGLTVTRLIFVLPQYEGLPLATEVQRIEIKSNSGTSRNIRIVYTGMFGLSRPMAQWEDVIYSTVIMQSRVLQNDDGSIIAISPDYYPEFAKLDQRFHSLIVHNNGQTSFANEFCMNYNEFVGSGTLNDPNSLHKLSNRLSRKGPGFFALASEFNIDKDSSCIVDNFTGLVSDKANGSYDPEKSFLSEVQALIDRFSDAAEVENAFNYNLSFLQQYSDFLKVETENKIIGNYFNNNLPFQILYQTFVSRSFAQTQKGYREMGFREIQDLFASMYYFTAMGKSDLVKDLLTQWCSQIYQFGYANHNFFWVGKEPGGWSDDALWFIQALYRYISLSGDIDILNLEVSVAGTDKKRRIYDTVKAVIRYSAIISTGKHGLPLLDRADWNDTLRVDVDSIDGPTKERLYKEQIAPDTDAVVRFESDYSESVMNAFLLKLALDEAMVFAEQANDISYKNELKTLTDALVENIQKHAWKEDFFCRVLINRPTKGGNTYLGAKGDGFSSDPDIDGVFFLNSFSWSILSDVASDDQIEKMLDVINNTLKTPYGYKLVSPSDLSSVTSESATEHYFPGDRENGGVFKHACMMATSAMFKAAKTVKNKSLAKKLSDTAYEIVDIVFPFRTLNSPFEICGNPRICTQYNNSDTGENIGPLLSGTSTWLLLTLMEAFGIEYTKDGIVIEPVLRSDESQLKYSINTGKSRYKVTISKTKEFKRFLDTKYTLLLDGKEHSSNLIPIFDDNATHTIEISFA